MFRRLLSTFFVLTLFFGAAHAGEPVSTGFFSDTAIGGQDTVSYFTPEVQRARKVLEGDKRFEVTYLGANWRFASRASADKFAVDPAKYAPHYNGHCANALSLGEGLVTTDGTVWEFFGDQLYLFYSDGGRQRWLKGDWKVYRTQADAAWQAIVAK
jgi:YHS domain-containing protein